MQKYGINLAGDIGGFAFMMAFLWVVRDELRLPLWWVLWGISTWGSLTIIPRAIARQDPGVFTYHAMWVVIGIVAVLNARTWLPYFRLTPPTHQPT